MLFESMLNWSLENAMILEYNILVSIPKYSPPFPILHVMVLIEGGALGLPWIT